MSKHLIPKPGKINLGIRGKLLLPTVATLIIVIIGLSGALVTVQKRLNGTMRKSIEKTIVAANADIGKDLEKLKEDIRQSLDSMSTSSGEALGKSTTKALNKQKSRIEFEWETMMRENAESMALLMARVAPNAILGNDFQALNGFVSAALKNPNVIYAFYFRKDGRLLTRYIDRQNQKIKSYMETEGKDRYQKILNAASHDNGVMIINKPIDVDGDVLGNVELCIDKAAVMDKLTELDERFAQLVQNNKTLSFEVLQEEAAKVQGNVGSIVESIIDKNKSTVASTASRLEEASAATIHQTQWINLTGGIICILLVVAVLIVTIQRVFKPLNQTLHVVKDIAEGEGDLTIRLKVQSHDEVGELSKWFNSFLDKLQGIIGNIAGTAGSLGSASTSLSDLAGKLADGAEHMSGLSSTVASAAEEMSANMNTVADSSNEAATNVNMVSSAAEEMTATINEIAMNSEKARVISEKAVAQTTETTSRMEKLGQAAQSIGKVTQTIADISDQTNLLALNATIEAARAGEVGKGFAVVANEIKELAKQTAGATLEIRNQIDGIQGSATESIDQIDKISQVIHNINEIVSTIATAVEEQSVTTKEIAGNVAQASQGIQEVNENVSQSSVVSMEIAKEISSVNNVSSQLNGNSAQMKKSAAALDHLADELNELVGRFKY
jgi:methyl-accepting chemotaxis protein